MKFQKSCFWILICGVYLVCSSIAFGHMNNQTAKERNGYSSGFRYLPGGATAANAEVIMEWVNNSFGHPSGNSNSSNHNPEMGACKYHKHKFQVDWTDTAEKTAIEAEGGTYEPFRQEVTGEWICSDNSAPTFSPSQGIVHTGSTAIGTTIGTITATDADGDILRYVLTGDHMLWFSIDSSTGQLSIARAITPNDPYQVTVHAYDGRDGYASIGVSIVILSFGQQQSVGQSSQQRSADSPDPNLNNLPGTTSRDAPPPEQFSPEDVNQDGTVDDGDLLDIAMNFGETSEDKLARYDLDGDGDIDSDDFLLVQQQFEQNGNPAAPAALHTPQERLRRIVERDNPGAAVRVFIQFPEKPLAAPVPKATVLLPNYPNPFNPETWIPYRLAEPADVTLTIYATNGEVVRTLALGHQSVGSYLDRARAAYWDGKNALGESVASGVYFYHLSAGDYSATRRMLILK